VTASDPAVGVGVAFVRLETDPDPVRVGHSSSRAALIYLHSTSDRQRTLADAVTDRVREELGENEPVARVWHERALAKPMIKILITSKGSDLLLRLARLEVSRRDSNPRPAAQAVSAKGLISAWLVSGAKHVAFIGRELPRVLIHRT
jgi:hypothetical protein